MKKLNFLSATAAERFFVVAVVGLILLLVGNFFFVSKLLISQSRQADHTKIEAEVSNNDIKTIESAGRKMNADPDALKRAELIVAESKFYQYQDQIIKDLNGYGTFSGIAITGYNFSQTSAPAATPPSSSSPSSSATPSPTAQPATPTGVTSTTVNVTLEQQVDYTKFLIFLKLIERNVTRMQVTEISLTPNPVNPNQLVNPSLTIMVFKR